MQKAAALAIAGYLVAPGAHALVERLQAPAPRSRPRRPSRPATGPCWHSGWWAAWPASARAGRNRLSARHGAALMRRENAALEAADTAVLARLSAECAELLARLGHRLPGRALGRPALESHRNVPFLPEAETWIIVRFAGPAPEAPLRVNGIEAEAAPEPGQFRLGIGPMAELAQGAVPDLDLGPVLR